MGLLFRPRAPVLHLAAAASSCSVAPVPGAPERTPLAPEQLSAPSTTAELERLHQLHAAGAPSADELAAKAAVLEP
jgi:hypothetical protein